RRNQTSATGRHRRRRHDVARLYRCRRPCRLLPAGIGGLRPRRPALRARRPRHQTPDHCPAQHDFLSPLSAQKRLDSYRRRPHIIRYLFTTPQIINRPYASSSETSIMPCKPNDSATTEPTTPEQVRAYEQYYDDARLWHKIRTYAQRAGYEVLEKTLWLYYAAQQP